MDKIQSYRFTAAEPGPKVLFFGTVHGDEVCGYQALSQLQQQLASGALRLLRGELTLVPLCNPRAYHENKRFCDENLNRVFKHHPQPASYEAGLANQLCPLLVGQDWFVDFHSAPDTNEPFAIMDHDHLKNRQLFTSTGLRLCLTGWPSLFSAGTSYCTTDEAERLDIPALTIECGQHQDPSSRDVAYQVALRVLAHLVMIAPHPQPEVSQEFLHLVQLAKKTAEGTFTRQWRQGDKVKAGTCIVEQQNGEKICAAQDGVLIMPDPNVPLSEAWFYLAIPA